MKTTHPLRHLFPVIACPLFALAVVSCQTTSNPSTATRVPVSVAGTKWVKVGSQPPTYYPQGVAADCPTDHWSGEWVYTGDECGTRYFIPLHGLGEKRQMLVHDALSARSSRKLAEVAAQDDEIRSRNIRNLSSVVLLGPPAATAILIPTIAGVPPDVVIDSIKD